MPFHIKRVYEPPASSDGLRILVDRLWPRGLKKTDARLDHWLKDVAPSSDLRTWFGHKPERFAEFCKRYAMELAGNPAWGELRKLGRGKTATLLYSAHDPDHNQARVLLSLLQRKPRRPVLKTPAKKAVQRSRKTR